MNIDKKFNYKIIPELNLIIDVLIGEFGFFDIINNKVKQMADVEWRENYNILCDVRLAKIKFEDEEIVKFRDINSNNSRWNTERKTASLTRNPNQVVFEMILEQRKPKDSKIQLSIFSTLEAALNWLGIDFNQFPSIQIEIDKLIDK